MTVFTVNKPLPLEEQVGLMKVRGDRAFVSVDGNIMFAYIVMNNIRDGEVMAAMGGLTVNAAVKGGYAFMQLVYDGFVFDMPVIGEDSNAEIGNALSIILVDENGYIVKNIRPVGLSGDIMGVIHRGRAGLVERNMGRIMSIYEEYPENTLFEGGTSQYFSGILNLDEKE